jgi:membrane protein DedA with SNARE-associated domain
MRTVKRIFEFLAKMLTLLFAGLTLILILISLMRPEWIKSGIAWIGELIQVLGNWNYLIAFASACIESLPIIGTAVPGMNIMILVGGFWGKTHILPTVLLASLGAMIGNYLGYWVGKWYGHTIIEKYGDYIGLGRTEQKILEKQIAKNGFWYIVFGKFHNFTRAFVPFIAGASGMDRYELILDNLGKIALFVIIAVFGYFYFFRKDALKSYMSAKMQEIEEKAQKQPTPKA